ncbi:MAG: recombinase family protein [Alphaproteobacteria bacterium]|nr:recombinase family protein [Alphaproteobacteria bacterium]
MLNYIESKKMTQNLKAVVFARVSTREQKEGYSIDGQLHRIEKYCESKQIPIIATYTPAESSTRGARKKFFEMLDFVKKQKMPIAIVCDKVDRLQRSFKEYHFIMDLVDNHKTQLHFVTENEVLTKDSNSNEFMMYHMSIVIAEGYVKCLSDNVKRGMREMPDKGEYFHTAPVGYLNQRTSRHQTTIIVDPIMGPIVRKLFREYATGLYSLADITRMANNLGFKTIRNGIAHKQTIINMLNNHFYYGYMRCYGKLYPHNYEKLISKELFDTCQDLLHGRSWHKKRKINDLYRGLIYCENCGRLITPDVKQKTNGRVHRYLFCPHCKGARINENIVDAKIKDDLCRLKKMPITWLEKVLIVIQKEVKEKHKIEIEEQRSLKSQKTQLESRKEVLLDRLLDNSITRELYHKKLNDINIELEKIDSLLNHDNKTSNKTINSLEDLILLVSKIPEIYESSNSDEKRKVLKLLYSNFLLEGKNPLFSIRKPLENILSGGFRQMWSGQLDSNQ